MTGTALSREVLLLYHLLEVIIASVTYKIDFLSAYTPPAPGTSTHCRCLPWPPPSTATAPSITTSTSKSKTTTRSRSTSTGTTMLSSTSTAGYLFYISSKTELIFASHFFRFFLGVNHLRTINSLNIFYELKFLAPINELSIYLDISKSVCYEIDGFYSDGLNWLN